MTPGLLALSPKAEDPGTGGEVEMPTSAAGTPPRPHDLQSPAGCQVTFADMAEKDMPGEDTGASW